MRIRFWGTRGSIPKPGPSTVRYGGNTSCVEVRAEGTLIVLDCGTGAHELGQQLVAVNPGPMRGRLLISHTHWDHIQGFPFFAPLFVRGSEWDVYAPHQAGRTLAEILARFHRAYPAAWSIGTVLIVVLVIEMTNRALVGHDPERALRALSPTRPRLAVSALGEDAVLQGALATALAVARRRLFDPATMLERKELVV